MGWPDLLSKRGWMVMVIGDNDEDNLYDADELSRSIPDANATALDPLGYSQLHTLAHVAADHEAVMQSTNSQWNNRSHKTFSSKPTDRTRNRWGIR